MTNTKHPGIRQRHSRGCASRAGRRCNCNPSYEAFVFDSRAGRKLRKTFPNYAAAKVWRSDALGEVRRGRLRAGSNLTLRAAAEAWLEGAKAGTIPNRSGAPYKPSVLRLYESCLRRFVLPELGALQLSALRRADLQGLVDRLVAAGASPAKVHNVLMPVRALCRYALERDQLSVNPTSHVRLPVAQGRRERAVSPQEAAELIEVLPEHDRALWWCAALAGLRRGELRALRWRDVDLATSCARAVTATTSCSAARLRRRSRPSRFAPARKRLGLPRPWAASCGASSERPLSRSACTSCATPT
jgi:integrase